MDDHQLLLQFVQSRSQEAFRELVDRNLPMVYAAAFRLAGDSHLAQEVAQEVFTTLAQKAENIRSHQVLGGWLYKTTRHLAMHAVRSEQRRHTRERIAVSMHSVEQDNSSDEILDQLEPAMAELEEGDHDALVLRYLQDRTLKDVGMQMGISEDAARMRVNRALERLRGVFENRGLTVASTVIASALAAGTSTAVPTGLAGSISLGAISLTATAATLGTVTLTSMHWFNTKSVAAIIGASLLAASGTYFVQQGKIDTLRSDQEVLSTEQQKLSSEYENSRAAAEAMEAELEQLRKNTSELMRLRNEVAGMRREREAAMQAALVREAAPVPVDAAPVPIAFPPGSYVSKEQLVFAGFTTPEAGLQSMVWAMIKGDYEDVSKTVGPRIQDSELNNPKSREGFARAQAMMAPAFKGIQILARKDVSDEEAQLKVKNDFDPIPDVPEMKEGGSRVTVETLVKVDGEWKLNGSTKLYREEWDNEGNVRTYAE